MSRSQGVGRRRRPLRPDLKEIGFVTRERMQPRRIVRPIVRPIVRRIGALLVFATSLALLPALHAHLPGVTETGSVAFATSGPAGAAGDASRPCPLCRVSSQTRLGAEVGRPALPTAPAKPCLRLPAIEQPALRSVLLRHGAPPRAPPVPLS
jgi:hypothetical protein